MTQLNTNIKTENDKQTTVENVKLNEIPQQQKFSSESTTENFDNSSTFSTYVIFRD